VAHGRCAGCALVDSNSKKVLRHVLTCPDYLSLYKRDPSRALDPEPEYERWQREENSDEARALLREERLQKRFAALDEKREAQVGRWATPPDPLDD
jgi:hypothetical protein